jgi:hypothetical protein
MIVRKDRDNIAGLSMFIIIADSPVLYLPNIRASVKAIRPYGTCA